MLKQQQLNIGAISYVGASNSDITCLNGREYVIIKTVALIEGVRHGQNSKFPELVLAQAFGANPFTWDGRPVIVNHPSLDVGGSDVSVLGSSYLGQMMNTEVKDGKLLTECWIDLEIVENTENLGVIDVWKRLSDGETLEASIGALVYSNSNIEGIYEGNYYKGVWDIVIPDHLAILDKAVGACSISDGCGANREFVNQEKIKMYNVKKKSLKDANQKKNKKKKLSNEDKDSNIVEKIEENNLNLNLNSSSNENENGNEVDIQNDGMDEKISKPDKKHVAVFKAIKSVMVVDGSHSINKEGILQKILDSDPQLSGAYLTSYNDTEIIYVKYDHELNVYNYYSAAYTSSNDNYSISPISQHKVVNLMIDFSTPNNNDNTDNDNNNDNDNSNNDLTESDNVAMNTPKKQITNFEELMAAVGAHSLLGQQLAAGNSLLVEQREDLIAKIMTKDSKFSQSELLDMSTGMLDKIASIVSNEVVNYTGNAGNNVQRNEVLTCMPLSKDAFADNE